MFYLKGTSRALADDSNLGGVTCSSASQRLRREMFNNPLSFASKATIHTSTETQNQVSSDCERGGRQEASGEKAHNKKEKEEREKSKKRCVVWESNPGPFAATTGFLDQ